MLAMLSIAVVAVVFAVVRANAKTHLGNLVREKEE